MLEEYRKKCEEEENYKEAGKANKEILELKNVQEAQRKMEVTYHSHDQVRIVFLSNIIR